MSCNFVINGEKFSENQLESIVSGNLALPSIRTTNNIIVKPGVEELFNENPELANIGTQEQYSQYLDTIFPDSQVKDIVYHGTRFIFDKFDKSKIGLSTLGGKAFYFTKNFKSAERYAWNDMYEDGTSQGHFVMKVILNMKSPSYNSQISDINISLEQGQIENLKQEIEREIQKIGRVDTQGTFFPGSLPHSFFKIAFNKDNTAYLQEIYVDNKETILIELGNGRKKLDKKLYTREEFLNISQNNVQKILKSELLKAEKLIKDYNEKVTNVSKTTTLSYTKENDGVIQYNNKTNEYIVFEPEQIHILGSQADIQGFQDFVNSKSIKEVSNEGVEELFNENPELANVVYEVSGLITLENNKLEQDIKGLIKDREHTPSSIFLSYLIDNNLIPKIQEYITSISHRHGEWDELRKRLTLDYSPINTKSEKAKLISHELMHALSHKYITSYEALRQPDFKEYIDKINENEKIKNTNRTIELVNLTKEQLDAFDNLVRIKEKVFDFIKTDKFTKNEKLTNADFGSLNYAFSKLDKKEDIHEFISEAFSNPILVDVLKQIPTEGNKSNLFIEFIKALKIILGFNNESIIEDILYYSEKAFINEALKESNVKKQQALQVYSQYLYTIFPDSKAKEIDSSLYTSVLNQLEQENKIEKDCTGRGKLKAEKGLQTNFTKGGEWKLIKDLKGYPTHEEGGVDLTISKNGVSIKNGNTEFTAKHGLVIPKN